jgi:hypothetical protein
MKLFVHASIFSVIFAGFVASALTTKHTASLPAPCKSQHGRFSRYAGAELPSQYRLRTLAQINGTDTYPRQYPNDTCLAQKC